VFPHTASASTYSLRNEQKNPKTLQVKSLVTNDVRRKIKEIGFSCGEIFTLVEPFKEI
jgi:hypothetical protein